MPLPIEVAAAAERELGEAFAWYRERSPGAAARLLVELEQALVQVQTRPELGTP